VRGGIVKGTLPGQGTLLLERRGIRGGRRWVKKGNQFSSHGFHVGKQLRKEYSKGMEILLRNP